MFSYNLIFGRELSLDVIKLNAFYNNNKDELEKAYYFILIKNTSSIRMIPDNLKMILNLFINEKLHKYIFFGKNIKKNTMSKIMQPIRI